MKTYKLILSTLALAVVFSASSFAQNQADVNVTAEAVPTLSLTPTDVAFGVISVNSTSYLPANGSDGTAEKNTGVDAAAGKLDITGSTGATVKVTFGTATLSDGTHTATFTPTIYSGANAITSGVTDVTLTGGAATLDIGGALTAITDAGTYDTDVNGTPLTITVQYN